MLWYYLLRYARHRRWVWVLFDTGDFAKVLPIVAWPGWVVYDAPERFGSPRIVRYIRRTSTFAVVTEEFSEGEAARLEAIYRGYDETIPVGESDDDLEEESEDEDEDGDGDVPAEP